MLTIGRVAVQAVTPVARLLSPTLHPAHSVPSRGGQDTRVFFILTLSFVRESHPSPCTSQLSICFRSLMDSSFLSNATTEPDPVGPPTRLAHIRENLDEEEV